MKILDQGTKLVGVYVSGGLDSAALLCKILDETAGTDVKVTCFTVKKRDSSIPYAARLVNKIAEHFNINLGHIVDIENDVVAYYLGNIGQTPVISLARDNPGMKLYMGINRMPLPDIKVFAHKLSVQYHDHNPFFASPFLSLNKPEILQIFYDLGCEHIIPYTKSCTRSDSYVPCGNCYSCEERAWGFEILNKVDPGTIPL
jgi:7-cyano-7-deazaguanine synthase in queuosine biosynthesis